jgi:hypothetical protein
MNRKLSRGDGSILQFIIWELLEPLPGSAHRYKYRFYYGREGIPIVRYDNERARGIIGTREDGKNRTPSSTWTPFYRTSSGTWRNSNNSGDGNGQQGFCY